MTEEIKQLIEKGEEYIYDNKMTTSIEGMQYNMNRSQAFSLLAIAKILAIALEKGE